VGGECIFSKFSGKGIAKKSFLQCLIQNVQIFSAAIWYEDMDKSS